MADSTVRGPDTQAAPPHERTRTVRHRESPRDVVAGEGRSPAISVLAGSRLVQRVPAPGTIAGLVDEEVAAWLNTTEEVGDFREEAFAWRMVALLDFLASTRSYDDEAEFDRYVLQLMRVARVEWPITAAFLGEHYEDALWAYPRAFPLAWGQRVFLALYNDVDEGRLLERSGERWDELEAQAETLPVAIKDWGLPVPFESALGIERFALSLVHTQLDRDHAVRQYARANLNYARSGWAAAFAIFWNRIAENVRDSIFAGEQTVDPANYESFVRDRRVAVQSLVERMQSAEGRQAVFDGLEDEVARLEQITWVQSVGGTLGGLFGFVSYWNRGSARFELALVAANGLIRDLPFMRLPAFGLLPINERTLLAFEWIWDNGYLGSAGEQLWNAIREHGWVILGTVVAFIVVQFIPYLNVAVDVALLIYSGVDAVGALLDMKNALQSVSRARTVVELQRRSAELARSLTGDGLRLVLDLIGIATGVRGIRVRMDRLRSLGATADEALERAIAEADPRVAGIAAGRGFSRWESALNAETRAVLQANAGLRRLYSRLNPLARRLLTHCASLCIPTSPPPSEAQIALLNTITRRLGSALTPADIQSANRLLRLYRFELDAGLEVLNKNSVSSLRSSLTRTLDAASRRAGRIGRPRGAIPDDSGVFTPRGTAPAIDPKLIDLAVEFRRSTSAAAESFHANYAVFKVRIRGRIRYIEHANQPGGLHSESLIVRRLEHLDPGLRNTRILQVLSERPPCWSCQGDLVGLLRQVRAEFPVFYFVPRAVSRGRGAYLRRRVYGL